MFGITLQIRRGGIFPLMVFLGLLLIISPFGDGNHIVSANTGIIPIEQSTLMLSGLWHFATDPGVGGQDRGWMNTDFDHTTWETVAVPHTWSVTEAYSNYDGVAWYRRVFTAPIEAQDAHVRLKFDAVFYEADVWLNGEYLGEHEGGYTPFIFDVSEIIQPGTDNVIAVRADNIRSDERIPAVLRPGWSFDWWNHGGIVRDVTLQLNSRAFIERQRIVAEPNLVAAHEADTATVTRESVYNGTENRSKQYLAIEQ